jgi:hypothetical protein
MSTMFSKYFDTTAIDAFADAVVRELQRLVPAAAARTDAPSLEKLRARLDTVLQREVKRLTAGASLNFLQKARVGTRLQDRVEAAGYPPALAGDLARASVQLVAIAASRPR